MCGCELSVEKVELDEIVKLFYDGEENSILTVWPGIKGEITHCALDLISKNLFCIE